MGAAVTSDEHKAAAEAALTDAYGTDNPTPALLRGIIHAVLALIDEGSTNG